ncbi:MAG: InlB B-repeat-containing protein, partial [Faecalicoccus sp.]|nr:InlB B-repeat-containing protein [Faecalicoccus sp.]
MKTFKFVKVISAIVVSTSMCAGTALPVFALPETNVYTESPNGSTYTLTYDENADEDIDVPKDQTCKDGDSIKISKDKPKRDGYTFVGWSTDKDYVYDEIESKDDKEFFEPGDKIELTEDTTLYAVWEIKENDSNVLKDELFDEGETEQEPFVAQEPVTYQLMFDAHGGNLSFDHVDTDESGNATIPMEEPTKDGNTFQGWADDPESGEVDYHPGDALTISSDLKLYAVWQKVVTYQLMFDAHGGNLSFDHVDTDASGNATIPMEEPTKDGNTFQGWADDPESGEVDYHPGDTLTLSSDMKLYAVWQKDVVIYQLMFDAHGGNLSFDHVDTDASGNATIPAEEPTKDGNTFKGWADDPESGIVMYLPGDTLTLSNDMKLYAVWGVNPVTVQIRFDATGGSGAPEAINAEEGSAVTIPDQTPTKDGFNFLGWATDPESGKVTYTPGQEITAEDMRLYAVWEQVAQDIQIRFDASGGNGGPSVINAKKGDKVTIPAETPTKDGYKFLGWATDPESGKVTYTPGQE